MWKVVRGLLLTFGALLAAASTIAMSARVTGLEWGPLAYAVAALPWASLAAAAVLVVGLVTRSRALSAIAAVLLIAGAWWLAPLYVADQGTATGTPALTAATINLTLGSADADAVVALVRDRHVDLLALEELTPQARERLRVAGLDDLLPHSAAHPEPGVTGTGLWSRYAITAVGTVDGFVSQTVQATVQPPSGALTVLAVHPAAPGPVNHDRWNSDTAHLRDVLAALHGPILMLGDFNTTRDQHPFRQIEAMGYVDATDQAGDGLQLTFPQDRTPVPLVGIDHVLTRQVLFHAGTTATAVVPNADHRALIVQFFLPSQH